MKDRKTATELAAGMWEANTPIEVFESDLVGDVYLSCVAKRIVDGEIKSRLIFNHNIVAYGHWWRGSPHVQLLNEISRYLHRECRLLWEMTSL